MSGFCKTVAGIAALCVTGGIAGFMAGRHAPVESAEVKNRSQPRIVRDSVRPPSGEDPAASGDAAAAELSEALAMLAAGGSEHDLMPGIAGRIAELSLAQLPAFLDELAGVEELWIREPLFGKAIRRWAELDPDGALDRLGVLEEAGEWPRSLVLSQYLDVFDELTRTDPVRAFSRWTESEARHGPGLSGLHLYRIIDGWREQDPDAAFEVAIGTGRAEAVRALCSDLDDPRYRSALYQKLIAGLSGEKRAEALGMFVRGWAGEVEDRAEVAGWIDDQPYTADEKAAADRALANVHLRRTGAETADWLVSRATPRTLSGHLETIVGAWAQDSPNACGEWLAQLGLGPHADAAVSEFATTVMRDDLVSAFAWAQEVTDSDLRFGVLSKVTSYAARRNPAAAREAIGRANIGDEQSARLLRMLE